MRMICVVFALVAAGLIAGSTSKAHDQASVKPLLVLTGSESSIDKPTIERVASQEQLRALWLKHLGKTPDDVWKGPVPSLDVDFERCMVIAIFQGAGFNSRGLSVVDVIESADRVTVRFDDMSFQTSGGAANVTVYAFIVLHKSDKPVVIEEDVQGLKDQPPQWKERAKL